MPPSPSLQQLIDIVRTDTEGEDALLQLSQASQDRRGPGTGRDALLGHFVDQCRRSGRSWSEISVGLGVSKQAAHKRFAFGAPTTERFTDRGTCSPRQVCRRGAPSGTQSSSELSICSWPCSSHPTAWRHNFSVKWASRESTAEVQILTLIKPGTQSLEDDPPLTPRAREVIREATSEALRLGHNYVGTEHLLLAQFNDKDAIASKVLAALGASYEIVRARIIERPQGSGTTI